MIQSETCRKRLPTSARNRLRRNLLSCCSIRLPLSAYSNCSCQKMVPQQLDIKSAFLYGNLKEEIYMHRPQGFRQPGKVCRLKKALYGLKQAHREWHRRLTDFLTPYGFKPASFYPCVLIHDILEMIIAIYVDDLTLWGESGTFMDSTKELLKTEFEVTDLGNCHNPWRPNHYPTILVILIPVTLRIS